MSQKPAVTEHPDGSLTLAFPFNRGLVDELKNCIPSSFRRYLPDTKAWEVWGPVTEQARDLVLSYYPYAAQTSEGGASEYDEGYGEGYDEGYRIGKKDATVNASGDYAVLHLVPGAPLELVAAAQRTLAKLHHPDVGGSTAKMQEVNNAADRIRFSYQQRQNAS